MGNLNRIRKQRSCLAGLGLLTAALAFGVNPRVETLSGTVEGVSLEGVDAFKGIPFAAPPVGELRWKAPQPVEKWDTVRAAHEYGPSPMQYDVYGDIEFGPAGVSEDCLYLNVWVPSEKKTADLPVLIYFNGGGLICGNGAEPRYAGESLARKGIIVVTANYREGIFGFYSHPKLSSETAYGGSGNYGLLDMVAAIEWVKNNIAPFGGDPDRITIAGESAGSISVSALTLSPLSRGLIAGAIGSSGSTLFSGGIMDLATAEKEGEEKMRQMGCESLDQMRAMDADELLEKSQSFGLMPFVVDGYFMPEQPLEIMKAGAQADVPMLIGWNSLEAGPSFLLRTEEPTLENLKKVLGDTFGDETDEVLRLYGITTDADVTGPGATQLASDLFIGYITWKWTDLQGNTAKSSVYRYLYTHPRPWKKGDEHRRVAEGAVHAADIEYAMGNLDTNTVYDWQPDDYKVSEIFQDIYLNFVKTGNPNPSGAQSWTPINVKEVPPVMQISGQPEVTSDSMLQTRYKFIDKAMKK